MSNPLIRSERRMRLALLAAAMATGKLDVRAAAAKLPDLPVDDLPPEDTMQGSEPEEAEL